MTDFPNTALIGGGIMGEAISRALLSAGVLTPAQLAVSDPLPTRCEFFTRELGARASTRNVDVVGGAGLIILSIKPQNAREVARELRDVIAPDTLILSIMAGVSVQALSSALHDGQPIVRAMPNTPAQIGMGMSVWTCTSSVSATQREHARKVLSVMGEEIYADHEDYLDMATALNGSGPAYVFLFMEALIDAGVHMGLPRHMAEKLVTQTVRGSVEFAGRSRQHPAQLRNAVTSSGGTTAAALYQLEKGGLRTVISRAVWAAYLRSAELGKKA
ncbi:MAG: pyrroline-5-carboxylate reductase [Thermoflexales bacterium]|nr:pyrroline-5-carboxylate reductase [Thermoflexales bacterium]